MQEAVIEADLTFIIPNVLNADCAYMVLYHELEKLGIYVEVNWAEIRDMYEVD